MAGIFSLLMLIITLIIIAAVIAMAAILIGMFMTGLIGGIILLVTGKHFSIDEKKKVASRICIVVGVIFLIMAFGSAGVIVNYAMQIFG